MPDAPARLAAPLDDSAYTVSIEDAGNRYAAAGFPRPVRRLQKYCARGDLECRKVDTVSGEKYLITPESIDRHIAYIKETSGRAQPRPGAAGRMAKEDEKFDDERDASGPVQTRPAAPPSDGFAIFDHPYVKRLEREVDEFKGKYERQVRRTEQVLEDANSRLIELQQANAIASSETLAKYMLEARGGAGERASTAKDAATEPRADNSQDVPTGNQS